MTHDFVLSQGARRNDTKFINESIDHQSIPTQHGIFLMRSRLESQWAAHFEQRGFLQAHPGVVQPPCYFYEPAGCKKWPSYPRRHHYRVDFVLVYDVENRVIHEDESRAKYGICSRALRWEWISIKPVDDEQDRQYLVELVKFDSRHQRAFQCCGAPDRSPRIYIFTYNIITGGVDVRTR